MGIPDELDQRPLELKLEPPVASSAHDLPFHAIRWEDFERLCLRIVKLDTEPEHAQRFGTPGQDQSGIDIYARHVDGVYAVYQCRRVAFLTDADLRSAVDDFLAGEWGLRATRFVFCTSQSSVPTKLAVEIENQAARLRACDPPISFEVWDAEVLALRLRQHPDLVDEFFGRAWLERFLPSHVVAASDARLAEIQDTLARLEQRANEQVVAYVLSWDPEEAADELAKLLEEDQELFLRLQTRIGNPPNVASVAAVIEENPDWLHGGSLRPWRILALISEKAGEWAAASEAWNRAAACCPPDDDQRVGLLVSAAVAAGMGGDEPSHRRLLTEAAEICPDHPRVRLEQLDQALSGEARLAAIADLASDDPLERSLIASHRTLAYLLLGDVEAARAELRVAQQLRPRSVATRMLEVNVIVQQARTDAVEHRRLDATRLTEAHEDALRILRQLHDERRYTEAVRVRMLGADALTLVGEQRRALRLLTDAPIEELEVEDAGDVLGDAALRALGWREALALTQSARPSETVHRIRASALVESGTLRERTEAIETLDNLISGGGEEALQAALFRIAAALDPRAADWNPEAAEVLKAAGMERAAITAQAFFLDRRKSDRKAAYELLDAYRGQTWSLLTKLRVAVMRSDKATMSTTAGELLACQPAQDVLVLCGQALGLAGDRRMARRVLESVASDGTCPRAVRADALALLVPLLADDDCWEAAERLHREWVEMLPEDSRHNVWAPTIGNRLRSD